MRRARILVVEDHEMSRRLVREILEYRGHEVLEATGVEDARVRLSEPLDLVLLDIQIPGGGGEELLREIRASPVLRDLPVLAVTASVMTGARERLIAIGFDEYIDKPIDTRTFGPRVESFLHDKGCCNGVERRHADRDDPDRR